MWGQEHRGCGGCSGPLTCVFLLLGHCCGFLPCNPAEIWVMGRSGSSSAGSELCLTLAGILIHPAGSVMGNGDPCGHLQLEVCSKAPALPVSAGEPQCQQQHPCLTCSSTPCCSVPSVFSARVCWRWCETSYERRRTPREKSRGQKQHQVKGRALPCP